MVTDCWQDLVEGPMEAWPVAASCVVGCMHRLMQVSLFVCFCAAPGRGQEHHHCGPVPGTRSLPQQEGEQLRSYERVQPAVSAPGHSQQCITQSRQLTPETRMLQPAVSMSGHTQQCLQQSRQLTPATRHLGQLLCHSSFSNVDS